MFVQEYANRWFTKKQVLQKHAYRIVQFVRRNMHERLKVLKRVLPPLVWACTIPTPTSNPHQSYQDVYLCNKIMYSVVHVQLIVDNNVPYYFRLEEKMKAKRAEKEEKEKKV